MSNVQIVVMHGVEITPNKPPKTLDPIYVKDGKQVQYQLYYNKGDGWIISSLFNNDLGTAIREAEACSRDYVAYGMTEVRDIQNAIRIVQFPAGGGSPYYINPDFKNQIEDAFNGRVVSRIEFPEPIQCNAGDDLSMEITLTPHPSGTKVSYNIIKSCPDCKDGFYYPFAGPKEPCRTCK